MTTASTYPIDAAEYGRRLADLIRDEFADPASIALDDGNVASCFDDLHEIVDANEFLLEIEEEVGIDTRVEFATDASTSRYREFLAEAIAAAEIRLGWREVAA